MRASFALGVTLSLATLVAACGDGFLGFGSRDTDSEDNATRAKGELPPEPNEDVRDNAASEALPNPLAGFPKGSQQLSIVCGRGKNNAVTAGLCKNPSITGVVELQNAIGLKWADRSANGRNGANGNPAFALLAHSSSLIAHDVSALNPRALVFTSANGAPNRTPGFVAMGFARGETFAELVAHDRNTNEIRFYLVVFEPACSPNCSIGDMVTPAVETGWKSWSLYDEEDLKNTILDCRHCHEPKAGGPRFLRMQELKDPWTHWMRNDRPGGVALFLDFLRAHTDKEDYGGIPAPILQDADGRALEDLVVGNGFGTQPNGFDSRRIEDEVKASASGQPNVNVPAGTSSSWQRLYDAAVRGEFIPPPYHDVKVTDPDKLRFAQDAYADFKNGVIPATAMPDIRKIFLDEALADMSLRPKKNATGREILVHMCQQCHHPGLDQSISRARFDTTKLDSMSRAEKEAAIARMLLPPSDIGAMPPRIMRAIPPEDLQKAIAELRK